jgi:hypothetical protein
MSGRGDNNKAGSAGRGISNQSSQGFGQASKQGKSNHGGQTGGRPSTPEKNQPTGLPTATAAQKKKTSKAYCFLGKAIC